MSRINLNNYEAFWLDYLEGNLSSEDTAEFLLFAAQHPALEIDLEDELPSLVTNANNSLTYQTKLELKELAELETLVVLELDSELPNTERIEALKLKYASAYDELVRQYRAMRLSAPSLAYADKQTLKQPVVYSMYWRVATAAAVIGIIATFFPWNSFTVEEEVAGEVDSTPVTIATSMDQLNPAPKVNHKAFIFKKDLPIDNFTDPGDQFIVDESPIQEDTTDAIPLEPLNEDVNIALDTAKLEPAVNLEENIALEEDSVTVAPVIDDIEDENIALNPAVKKLTVPEFLAEKVLKVEKQEEEPLIASILDQKTNLDVNYNETESNKKKVTQFKVGKFEFYKSSNK